MPGQLSEETIEERHARLLALINEIANRKYAAEVGRTVEILVEGPSRKNPARLEGRTRSNKIVVFDGSARHLGQLMDVRIERASNFTLYGDPAVLEG
jgi:tRNA-2-methylthio-N6-dimethylallyladenosine synthase